MKLPKYKLLSSGPLTTTETVKIEMLIDQCAWDEDYKLITKQVRNELLKLAHCNEQKYTTILLQGSGTYGIEAVITSAVGEGENLLICTNGECGLRMCDIAEHANVAYLHYEERPNIPPDAEIVAKFLKKYPEITHVAMVHCEAATGIINDIASISKVVKEAGKCFIVDAMNTFGGLDLNIPSCQIDFLVSSADKCMQGIPGFSFIIARREALEDCRSKARSLSLDIYDQWIEMEFNGVWRFTSPTHTVLAFAKALSELKEEGGIQGRQKRYLENNKILIKGMKKLGFRTYLKEEFRSPIITTFLYPENTKFQLLDFYKFVKNKGFAIYPGKSFDYETFRIGNIGDVYPSDMKRLLTIIETFLSKNNR